MRGKPRQLEDAECIRKATIIQWAFSRWSKGDGGPLMGCSRTKNSLLIPNRRSFFQRRCCLKSTVSFLYYMTTRKDTKNLPKMCCLDFIGTHLVNHRLLLLQFKSLIFPPSGFRSTSATSGSMWWRSEHHPLWRVPGLVGLGVRHRSYWFPLCLSPDWWQNQNR